MRSFRLFWIGLLLLALGFPSSTYSQSEQSVPTLVPPTLVPGTSSVVTDELPSESTIARIQRDGIVRVGILYNEPPYSEFSIRGEVTGFDADLARSIAETWEVEIEFVQVTRQNRFDMLNTGAVDMLLGAVVHERALDEQVEFGHAYRVGKQAMLVRATDEISSSFNLANRRVGYVQGSAGEAALRSWVERTALPIQPQPYFTYDAALSALFGSELDAIVGRDTRLLRTAANYLDAVELLDEAIAEEPMAIAMLRQDVYMRNLVNQTLQYLLQDGGIGVLSTLEQLNIKYFPGNEFAFDALPVYSGLDEAPKPSQYPTDIPFPQGYVIPRIQSSGIVRVAGLQDPGALPSSLQSVAQVNRTLIENMLGRWGMRLEAVEGDPISLIESGQADFAIGIDPHWAVTNRVDFSQPYLLHGNRLLASADRDLRRFGDLRGRILATISGDEGAKQNAEAWASSINVSLRYFETTEQSAARTILDDRNADILFGDSLILLPIYRFNTGEFEFGDRWYTREYQVIATPVNDIDFSRLVNYTLQEMFRDGTLATLLLPVLPPESEPPQIAIWPGSSTYLGWQLGR